MVWSMSLAEGGLTNLGSAIAGVEEINMFKDDGHVLHFTAPKGEHLF